MPAIRLSHVASLIAVLLPASLVSAQGPSRAALPAWMAGCWEQRSGDRVVEEHWLAPRGGIMLGSGRTTRGDSLVEFEQTRIAAAGDTLIFFAQPSGQAAAQFRTVNGAESEVRFENLAHDFPQRVIYRPVGDDSLVARVEGMRRGALRGFDFRYQRVPCAGGGEPRR